VGRHEACPPTVRRYRRQHDSFHRGPIPRRTPRGSPRRAQRRAQGDQWSLPDGYEEGMQFDDRRAVPLSVYPAGYGENPKCRCLLRSDRSRAWCCISCACRSSHSLKLVHQRIQEERQEARDGSVTHCGANGRAPMVASGSNRWRTGSRRGRRTVARVRGGTHANYVRRGAR
jgi:hypothetical protein